MTKPQNKADGWFLIHEMKEINWDICNNQRVEELGELFDELDRSGVYSLLGGSSDLMFIHIRPTLEELDRIRRKMDLKIDFLNTNTSYLSVAEIGGYTNEDIEKGEISDYAEKKLYPNLPDLNYASFYPMSRRRGEEKNWYTLSKEKRDEMLGEHRKTGRKYSEEVTQIVSGSIGLDDWEFGVTLFSDNPKSFKHIVYEMRFDKASSLYSVFGPFYTGIRIYKNKFKDFFAGKKV